MTPAPLKLEQEPPANDPQAVKTRVQLDFSPAHMERLNGLMDICAIETRKDLVNTALSLLEWAVNETVKGRTIAAVDNSSHRIIELGMPALADAARNAAARKPRQATASAEGNK